MSNSPVSSAQAKIAIALATYNGSKFLSEQLDSLLEQSYENFIIVVRDDGSSDDSLVVVRSYKQQHPEKFHLVNDEAFDQQESAQQDSDIVENLGASGSFSFLMSYILQHKTALGLDSAYIMFCDQDDTWYPEKIEQQLQAMFKIETDFSESTPMLVHSDLRVVAESNELIAISMARFQGLETERNQFCNIAISNLVTGCTALINEAAARKAGAVPGRAIMHDWWLAMVASAFGKLVFIDKPLVNYRQHASNTIGAKEQQHASLRSASFWRRVLSFQVNEHLQAVAQQADEFLQRFGPELNEHDVRGLKAAVKMGISVGLLQRVYYRRARRY